MPLCILCDSETTELLGATICKRCDTQYRLSEAAADELKQAADWLVWRFKLPVALRWQFRIHQQPTTIVGLAWAQSMVQEREDFYADIEGRNRDAVDALASPGPVMDPWHEPIMKLGRVLGRSREASLEFAEDLIARGKVRIATLEGISFEGAKPFGQFKHWERCEKRDGEQSEGK
jgi:hypothetical protein